MSGDRLRAQGKGPGYKTQKKSHHTARKHMYLFNIYMFAYIVWFGHIALCAMNSVYILILFMMHIIITSTHTHVAHTYTHTQIYTQI